MPVPKYWLLGWSYPLGLTVHQQRHRPSGSNKINGTNVLTPDANFDNTCLFSDARGQNN